MGAQFSATSHVVASLFPRRPDTLTDGQTSGRTDQTEATLAAVGCVCVCVSLVLPRLAHRQDVGVVVGGDLQACASHLIGGTGARKCCVITPEQMRSLPVDHPQAHQTAPQGGWLFKPAKLYLNYRR